MKSVKEKQKTLFNTLKDTFGYTSPMESPRVEKVIVSTGVGKVTDKAALERIEDRLARITGQKPAPRPARKSIASFKTRAGDIVGYQVTLRGERMMSFLDKLINIALPRTKDFRGIDRRSIDDMYNLTIGVPEHTIFPETSDEEARDVFGLSITIVTSATSREETLAFLEGIGFPFKKAS